MAATQKYPAAHEQLTVLAERARRAGKSFEEFWEEAVRPGKPPVTWALDAKRRPKGCVVWPRDTTDRNVSIASTLGARTGWQRAYDQLPPTRGELALAKLRPGLEALAEVSRERGAEELAAA